MANWALARPAPSGHQRRMKTRQSNATARVLLGEIAGVHGIRGDVLIHTYTADPQSIAAYGPLSNEAGTAVYEITVVRTTDKGVVAKITGIPDRTTAEKLRGTKLYVGRARLPEPDAAEFYHADLIGLHAIGTAGNPIGEVIAVQNYGAGDLLEIRRPGGKTTELIPFADAFVPAVDLAAGIVTVVIPDFAPDDEVPEDTP